MMAGRSNCFSRARVRAANRVNSVLQNFRSLVDDPVPDLGAGNSSIGGRADRPSSIVAPEPKSANNNSAKTKWRRRQQPQRRLEPVGLLGETTADAGSPRARALGQPIIRLSVLQNFRSFVDDPVPDLGAGNSSIGGRADRVSAV